MHPGPLFSIGSFKVYPYGVCIAMGLIACLIVFFAYTSKMGVNETVQDFVYFVAIFAIALGFLSAKLFQAFYDYLANPEAGFNFAEAGLTVMGGLVGGIIMFLAIYFGVGHLVFKNKNNMHITQFNEVLRVAPACITVAHAFGRIGCLMAGCCYGRETDSVLGIFMRGANRVPTQLYEAIFLFLLFAVLTVLYFKKFNYTHAVYLVSYAIWRFIIEIFRDDYRGGAGALQPSQWQSIVFILVAVAIVIAYRIFKFPTFVTYDLHETRKKKRIVKKVDKEN